MFERLLTFRKNIRMRTKTIKTSAHLLASVEKKQIFTQALTKNHRNPSSSRLLKMLTQNKRPYSQWVGKNNSNIDSDARLKELQDSIAVHKAFSERRDSQNIRIGILMHELAMRYGKLGDYNNSKETFEKALSIFEKCGGESDIDVGIVCSNLADMYYLLNDPEKSTALYERALTIFEKNYPRNFSHPHIKEVRRKLDRNYFLNEKKTDWASHSHFYAAEHKENPALKPSDQYLELSPRFYNF